MKKTWNIETTDKMPPRRGAGIQEDTKELIEDIKRHDGKIIKLSFSNKNELRKYFVRLKYAKRKGLFNYNKISRRGESLFIDMNKEHENKK